MKDNSHPNAQIALQTREHQLSEKKARLERLDKLVKQHALRFVHIRHEMEGMTNGTPFIASLPKGGATVAFQFCNNGFKGRRIKVAVALTHSGDSYCKKDGRFYAADHFDRGECIKLLIPKDMSPSEFLKLTFYYSGQR